VRDDLVAEKKRMQVLVYPQIRCRRALVPVFGPHLGWRTRWVLLPPREKVPPVTPLPEGPHPVVGPIVHPTPPDEEGVTTIEAALWKQSDGYFKGDRYDPAGITGYWYQRFHFSVDEEWLNADAHRDRGDPLIACGPNDGEPGGEGLCGLPEHESERIDVITLKRAPIIALTDEAQPVKKLKKGGRR